MAEIGDEIREFVRRSYADEHMDPMELLALADRIDRELVELPKDADGEYIRVGDTLDGYGKTIEVVELRYGRSGWVLISRDGSGYADTFAFAHHHEPTVEDVLQEFADEMNQNLGMYTGEAIDADEWRDADAKTVEKFAAKLRLAGDGE